MKSQPLCFLAFLLASLPGLALAQAAPVNPPEPAPSPSPASSSPVVETAPPPLPAPIVIEAPPPAPVVEAPPAPARAAIEVGPAPMGPVRESTDGPAADSRESMWRVEMGFRGSFVPSAGYDPFSTNDFLPEFSLSGSRTLVAGHHLSFAAGLAWDFGSRSADDRGDHASLSAHRLAVPLEGRVHFGPLGYIFVRAAPGVVAEHAEVDDSSAPAPLTKTSWLFATDVSGGLAWLLAPRTHDRAHARLWLQADGGYGWVVAQRLDLGPALASGDGRIVSGTDLGSLDLSGAFFRIAAAVSF